MEAPRATLIYDGRCSLCRGAIEWIRARDAGGAFEFVPFQEPDLEARYPAVRRAQCERAVTLLLPRRAPLAGAEALPAVLALLPRWRHIAPLLGLPPLRPLSRRLYDWIAMHRPRDPEGGAHGGARGGA
jgi:predicted DCC family thiol-disulfide oxidoreductase YuxK